MSLCFSSDLDFGSEARSYIALGPKHRQSKQHTRTPLPQQRGARSSTSAGRRALGRAGRSPRGAAATARLEHRVKGHRSCVWATAGRGGHARETRGGEAAPESARNEGRFPRAWPLRRRVSSTCRLQSAARLMPPSSRSHAAALVGPSGALASSSAKRGPRGVQLSAGTKVPA